MHGGEIALAMTNQICEQFISILDILHMQQITVNRQQGEIGKHSFV